MENRQLAWTNTTVRLGDLKPWENNPKRIGKAQAVRLLESFEEFGQPETVAIGPDCEVYDGHQRLSVLMAAHGPDYQLAARQSNRALTEEERKKLTIILHSGSVGSWNWEDLAGWDASKLVRWGLDNELLATWKNDAEELAAMLGADEVEDQYSHKLTAPIYTIKGDEPPIEELCDDSKVKELTEEIDASGLPEDIKGFLRQAANRHMVFDYGKIAEYYAHAPEEVQALMENSALVIIDFDRAIELGYVSLGEKTMRQYGREHNDDE